MTSTTPSEAQILADPDVPLVRITREFDASPEKVFRAHVDPELVGVNEGYEKPRRAARPQLTRSRRRS